MLHRFALTVGKDTKEDAPEKQEVPVTTGILTKGIIIFPKGCSDMVKVRVYHMGYQLWPVNTDEWLVGNGFPIEIREDYDLRDTPLMLALVGISPETAFSHIVTIYVEVLPPEVARPWEEQESLWGKFLKSIGVK